MVELGIKGRQETTVTSANVATNVGSGMVKVFATPMMISLIEKAAVLSIEPYLEDGQSSVGTHERFIIDIEKFQSKAESK